MLLKNTPEKNSTPRTFLLTFSLKWGETADFPSSSGCPRSAPEVLSLYSSMGWLQCIQGLRREVIHRHQQAECPLDLQPWRPHRSHGKCSCCPPPPPQEGTGTFLWAGPTPGLHLHWCRWHPAWGWERQGRDQIQPTHHLPHPGKRGALA